MSSGVLDRNHKKIHIHASHFHGEEENRLMVVIAGLLFLSLAAVVVAIFIYIAQAISYLF